MAVLVQPLKMSVRFVVEEEDCMNRGMLVVKEIGTSDCEL